MRDNQERKQSCVTCRHGKEQPQRTKTVVGYTDITVEVVTPYRCDDENKFAECQLGYELGKLWEPEED